MPDGSQWAAEWHQSATLFYDLERLPRYEDLEGRAIIDWGRGALAWHQKLSNKALLKN